MFSNLPKSHELQRLRRLREAALGKSGQSKMIPADDWLADLEERISALERGLRRPRRPRAMVEDRTGNLV